jgi:hypothetical protein
MLTGMVHRSAIPPEASAPPGEPLTQRNNAGEKDIRVHIPGFLDEVASSDPVGPL